MLKVRVLFLICSLALFAVTSSAWGQNADQGAANSESQTSTQSSDQTTPEPQLTTLPAVTASLPPGMLVYNAACFTINQSGALVQAGGFKEDECYSFSGPNKTLVAHLTARVPLRDDVATQLSSLGTQADSNYTLVQKAVLHAIVQVLADQSIKADQVAAIVKTASDQITDKVTQQLQKNLEGLVKKEVAAQLKAAAEAAPRKPVEPKKSSGHN
jgi:hypothetical protein